MTPKNAVIHLGDCLQVMKDMPSKSVDIVFTSPPYNLGNSRGRKDRNNFVNAGKTGKDRGSKLKIKNAYANHGDDFEYDEYVRWQKSVLLECWRLLKDDGAIYYNHKPRIQMGTLQTPLDLNPGLPLRQLIVWEKGPGVNVSARFYMPTTEWIALFAKPDFKLKSTAACTVGDLWKLGSAEYNPHPAPFPVTLPLMALESVGGGDGKVCLDPFSGSGSTGVACLKSGFRYVGIDNAKEYVEMAKNRLYLAEQGDFTSWNLAGA